MSFVANIKLGKPATAGLRAEYDGIKYISVERQDVLHWIPAAGQGRVNKGKKVKMPSHKKPAANKGKKVKMPSHKKPAANKTKGKLSEE